MLFSGKSKIENVIRNDIDTENKQWKPKILEKQQAGADLFENQHVYTWLRDCDSETPEPVTGVTKGNIPDWLNGTLLRNGPGKRTFGDSMTQHAFDGAALLRKFVVKNGEVTFQCKFLKSKMFLNNTEAERITFKEFGTSITPEPCKSIFQRFSSIFQSSEITDNCLVNVWPFRDEIYALTEACIVHRVDIKTLESLERVNVKDHVGIVHHTAHPHMETDGMCYNLGMVGGKRGVEYAIVEFPNSKNGSENGTSVFAGGKIVARIPTRWKFSPCYMHSFGMTPDHFIVIEQPVGMSAIDMKIAQLTNKSMYHVLRWYEEPTLIHVVCKKSGELIQTFEAETFSFFHFINAYEEDGNIVADVCCYKDMETFNALLADTQNESKQNPDFGEKFCGRAARFVCPLNPPKADGNLVTLKDSKAKAFWSGNKIQISAELLWDKSCEMPRINYEKYNGKKYRFFYAFSTDVRNATVSIIKVDTTSRTSVGWSEIGAYPSEPVFVPSPDSEEEDDGVVLSSLLYEDDNKKISLVVLNAKDMTELGRVDFNASGVMPSDFHGWFFNDVKGTKML